MEGTDCGVKGGTEVVPAIHGYLVTHLWATIIATGIFQTHNKLNFCSGFNNEVRSWARN